jgi:cysteine synthase A
MRVCRSTLDGIGATPLIRLRGASELTGCEIYGKAEWLNPGASVKDRAALGIVRDAERRGLLRPGGVIVEGTAGNTGIGLAVVANTLGYRTVIVMPDTQSQEKVDTLRTYGAEVRLVPAVPFRNPNHFVHQSRRLAERLAQREPNGVLWANQFDNTANRDFHVATTGPEIWEQTAGRVDGWVCSAGTGGTLAGAGAYLKERRPGVRVALADPHGSGLYHYYAHGEIKVEGSSIVEGIGNSRITRNLEGAPIDTAYRIPDSEAIPLVFQLLKEEGLCLGGSSGINVAGAIRLARELGPGHVVVTVLCDTGLRYLKRLYNPEFLASRGIEVPDWLGRAPIRGADEVEVTGEAR